MRDSRSRQGGDRVSRHILSTASTMVGVCTTLVGLVKIAEAKIGPSRVDEYAALCATLFMVSAITSYLSARNEDSWWNASLERLADGLFIVALAALTLLSLLFAYELT